MRPSQALMAGWFKDEFLINFSPEALALGNVAAKFGLPAPPSTLDVTYPTINMAGFTSLGNVCPEFPGATRPTVRPEGSSIRP